ncbi:MAG: serine/threonine-protein kinase [Roseococcus sp.]
MSASSDIPGGLPARYRIEKELGRGGMGSVVAAFDTTIRRRVAIKIAPAPPPGDTEQQQAFYRFRREAQLAGGLRHENIVGIYDFGADEKSAWMVMEIVEGGSLRELIQRTEHFTLTEVARIMVQMLDGLAFCHDQGIVHCDIKPANIMLSEPSTSGEVKIADFGIARNFGAGDSHDDDGEATRVFTKRVQTEEQRIGTPSHMAPEQFAGGTLDQRTDIWAAGIVLYHLLTRENPFTGNPDAIEAKVLNTEPKPPSQLSVLATPAFDALIKRALAKKPQDRFQDARSFAAAVLEATRAKRGTTILPPAKPAEAPPPAPAAKRNWVPLAAAGGGVAVLAAVAAFLLMPGSEPRVAPSAPPPVTLAQPAPAPAQPAPPPVALVQPTPAPTQPAPLLRPETPAPSAPAPSTPQPATPPVVAPQIVAPPAQAPAPQPVAPPVAQQPAAPPPALVPAAPLLVPSPAPSDTAQREARIQAAMGNIPNLTRCGAVEAQRQGLNVTLTGFLHMRDVPALRQNFSAAGLTPDWQVTEFEGPYCGLLSALRPILAVGETLPRITSRALQLRSEERLTLDFQMPDAPTTINLWFVMHDGQALRLLGDVRMRAGERRMMNETTPDFPWIISEPFGDEMVVMVAGDGPLFSQPRPVEETIDSLTEALRRAQAEGRRMTARSIMVRTSP